MSNLGRQDVERIVETILSELSLVVKEGDRTNPDGRRIELKWRDKLVTAAYFNITDHPEPK